MTKAKPLPAMFPPPNKGEKRIYCVVAHTVQVLEYEPGRTFPMMNVPSIVQPSGRQIAQACHAVSLLRLKMTQGIDRKIRSITEQTAPITTIILQARDTLELIHVQSLLNEKRIFNYAFYDHGNPDYGSIDMHVFTALATEPIDADQACTILDYLPLWGAECTSSK